MSEDIYGYDGFDIVHPDGSVISVKLPNSFVVPEGDVGSKYLMETGECFKAEIKDRNLSNIGLAFSKEISENRRSGRVGHWIYLGGIGFAFHAANTREGIYEGIAVVTSALNKYTVETLDISMPRPNGIRVNKSGNA